MATKKELAKEDTFKKLSVDSDQRVTVKQESWIFDYAESAPKNTPFFGLVEEDNVNYNNEPHIDLFARLSDGKGQYGLYLIGVDINGKIYKRHMYLSGGYTTVVAWRPYMEPSVSKIIEKLESSKKKKTRLNEFRPNG